MRVSALWSLAALCGLLQVQGENVSVQLHAGASSAVETENTSLKECFTFFEGKKPGAALLRKDGGVFKREAFVEAKCAKACLSLVSLKKSKICKAFTLTAAANGSLSCSLYESKSPLMTQDLVVKSLIAAGEKYPSSAWVFDAKKCSAANVQDRPDLTGFDSAPDAPVRAERTVIDDGRKPKTKAAAKAKVVGADGKVQVVGSGANGRVTWADVESTLSLDEKQLKDSLIEPDDVDVSFDDIVGLERVKQALRENVILPSINPRMFKGPLLQPAKGILLFGPPGNGKTYIAKAVAHEAGANFLSIAVSNIGSKWHGQGEKMMQAVFSLARKLQPTVVFFDEVDSLLTKRSDNEHDANRRIKTEFLTGLDGMSSQEGERVLALAATNLPYSLDDAALRRFPERFFVELPGREARENIIRKLVEPDDAEDSEANKHTFTDGDIKTLAQVTPCYSASDLTNLINAAFGAPLEEMSEKFNLAVEGGADMADLHVKEDELRPVTFLDLYNALKKVKPQANPKLLTKLIEWNRQFGAVAVEGPGSESGEQCAYVDHDEHDEL